MIRLDPRVPDAFLLLERKASFGEYARTYGERIAEHYERRGVVVVPHMPIEFDLDFVQGIRFREDWKKIGTRNGIERPVIERCGGKLAPAASHPLVKEFKNLALATYLQSQIASFNAQLRLGLRTLFPRYHSLQESNITWRLTDSEDQDLHMDEFDRGLPVRAEHRRLHRVKVFVNVDAAPRRWRVAYDLPGVLKACRSQLPDELPDDINVINNVLRKIGVFDDMPAHSIEYPTLAAVLVNAEVVTHAVAFGRRMVAGEFFCERDDMLDPARHTHDCLRGWLAEAGYRVAPDPFEFAGRYAHLMSAAEIKRHIQPDAGGAS
jgi:hypothetical protein